MVPDLERAVVEIFGGCNYQCQMCPQSTGRDATFVRKMPIPLFTKIIKDVAQYGTPVINLEGSGEPTMAKNLPEYIDICKQYDLPVFMFTNGANLSGTFMQTTIDAGINFIRFSIIGSTSKEYHHWMGVDNFGMILANMRETIDYIQTTGSGCQITSYHLLTTDDPTELARYINLIEQMGITGYIWKIHNWSGNIENQGRAAPVKTCGRPFVPELTVRSGGLGGQRAAVTPCCQTMGPPNEQLSVLGHLDHSSIDEVWNGPLYNNLRELHASGNMTDIEYCKNCDFLTSGEDVLVWTNDPIMRTNGILGTNIDLTAYS